MWLLMALLALLLIACLVVKASARDRRGRRPGRSRVPAVVIWDSPVHGKEGSSMTRWERACAAVALCSVLAGCSGNGGTAPSSLVARSPATVATTVSLPWPASPAQDLPAKVGARLQGELDRWIAKGFLPGATAAVVTPDGTWSGAAGVDGDGAALEASSGMALASITKTFTAAE